MSNQIRNDRPGQVFHVSSRINWRAWHLEGASAKRLLADLIAKAADAFDMRIFASVLMSNHFHAVLQSPPDGQFRLLTGRRTPTRHFRAWPRGHQNSSVLAQFMRFVRRTMSVQRQSELGLSGRFWEGRYDARLVRDPLGFAVRIAYDHRNPVVQGMAATPEEYPWSSAGEWATGVAGPVPLRISGTLPFGLRLQDLRAEILRFHRSSQLDGIDEDLRDLWSQRHDTSSELRTLLRAQGLLPCVTRDANV